VVLDPILLCSPMMVGGRIVDSLRCLVLMVQTAVAMVLVKVRNVKDERRRRRSRELGYMASWNEIEGRCARLVVIAMADPM
jgi:hypothetical protein